MGHIAKRYKSVYSTLGDMIPRMRSLRRVPTRCQQILPLEIVRRHQCVAIGRAGGVITVAVTNQTNTRLLEILPMLTGCTVFPVLVDPERMRLLIRRIERSERRRVRDVSPYWPLQIRSMLICLAGV